MKKLTTLTSLAIFLFSFNTNAQIDQGQQLLNLGIGLNSFYVSGSGYSTTLPPLEGSYEFMMTENISVGGFIGAYGAKYDYEESSGAYEVESKYNYLNFGGLANYHFVNDATWNVYVGARLGYVSVSTDYKSSYDFGEGFEDEIDSVADAKASGILFGVNAGARYHVSDLLALNAELGYGIALLKIGVTFKL